MTKNKLQRAIAVDETPRVAKKKVRISTVLAVTQSVIIVIVIALAVGFMFGKKYAQKQAETVHAQAVTLSTSLK